MSICSHLCEFVECAHEFVSHLKLIDVGLRTIVVCGNCKYCAVNCVSVIVSASIKSLKLEVVATLTS